MVGLSEPGNVGKNKELKRSKKVLVELKKTAGLAGDWLCFFPAQTPLPHFILQMLIWAIIKTTAKFVQLWIDLSQIPFSLIARVGNLKRINQFHFETTQNMKIEGWCDLLIHVIRLHFLYESLIPYLEAVWLYGYNGQALWVNNAWWFMFVYVLMFHSVIGLGCFHRINMYRTPTLFPHTLTEHQRGFSHPFVHK